MSRMWLMSGWTSSAQVSHRGWTMKLMKPTWGQQVSHNIHHIIILCHHTWDFSTLALSLSHIADTSRPSAFSWNQGKCVSTVYCWLWLLLTADSSPCLPAPRTRPWACPPTPCTAPAAWSGWRDQSSGPCSAEPGKIEVKLSLSGQEHLNSNQLTWILSLKSSSMRTPLPVTFLVSNIVLRLASSFMCLLMSVASTCEHQPIREERVTKLTNRKPEISWPLVHWPDQPEAD